MFSISKEQSKHPGNQYLWPLSNETEPQTVNDYGYIDDDTPYEIDTLY